MTKQDDNKAIVGRWFTDFWGKTCKLGIVDELAAPDMLLQYSLHEPRRGRDEIKAFMTDFPDLKVILNSVAVEGELAIYRWTLDGHNTGPGGTGAHVRISGFEEWRIGKDGLIARSLGHFDAADYQRQIGTRT